MIRYTLSCDAGHQFESWFRDSAAYDQQQDTGFAICPTCGSSRVGKTIMAPAIRNARETRRSVEAEVPVGTNVPSAGAADAGSAEAIINVALLDERRTEVRSLLKQLRGKILAESQDVGRLFPEQARRMHDGTIPLRQIRGQATPDEARDLLEDGVLILPLPTAPEDLN